MRKLWNGIRQWLSERMGIAGHSSESEESSADCRGCREGVVEALSRMLPVSEAIPGERDRTDGLYLSRIYTLLAQNPDDEFVNSKFIIKWDMGMKPCSRRRVIEKFGCEIGNSLLPVPDRIEFDESVIVDLTAYNMSGEVSFIPFGTAVLVKTRCNAGLDIEFFYEKREDGSGIHMVEKAMENFFGFDGKMVCSSSRIDHILVRHIDNGLMTSHEFIGCIPKWFDLNEGKVELVSNYVRTQTTGKQPDFIKRK